ncbi:MAG: GHKL domain-containing protein, partial [Aliifodinibius sp.]|nr:GHKL domain-containing protein [Fodinibius sp.]
AIEAIKEEGNITVSTTMRDNKVIIVFKDTGCGIPEHIKNILFTSNISTKSDGTGIGLNNVKRIIEDFGGSINIESANGKGTTVEISLP